MWYLYSLLFCYLFGGLLMGKIINQAEYNDTPLTNHQTYVLGLSMVIVMSIPLLNVIWSVDAIYKWMLDSHRFEDEIDKLIDYIRRSVP